ncbi:hypothetical protein ES702_04033 [subsurface metagenome]
MQLLREIEIRYKTRKVKGKTTRVTGLKIVFQLFKDLQNEAKEKLIVINLNSKNIINSFEVVGIGTLNTTLTTPREIFRGAIVTNSAAVLCVHNHPSGDPTPSGDDIRLTRKLLKLAKILHFVFLDHVIIGADTYTSIRKRNPKLFK